MTLQVFAVSLLLLLLTRSGTGHNTESRQFTTNPRLMTSTPIGDRKVRFALVGCGRISKNHIGAIEKHQDRAELVEICDTNPAALKAAHEATGARPFASLGELLAESTADAVVLATPSGLHPWQAIEVAQSGRHVVSEKPMATRWEDGKRMVKACDDARSEEHTSALQSLMHKSYAVFCLNKKQ